MKALEGVKILDFTHVQSGPTCTQLLAWLGADCIKVERPGVGDATRKQLVDVEGADSLYFTMLNHNKRSITLNTKNETGREVLERLVEGSDDPAIGLFHSDAQTHLEQARLAQTLLAGAQIPALLVHGVMLQKDVQRAPVRTMLGVWDGEHWLLFDPQTGQKGRPGQFMIWWRGEEDLLSISGARLGDFRFRSRNDWPVRWNSPA